MLKEDLDLMRPEANKLVDMLIDSIVFGPVKTEEQIKALWTIISERAKAMTV
jgi:hypothetical protein